MLRTLAGSDSASLLPRTAESFGAEPKKIRIASKARGRVAGSVLDLRSDWVFIGRKVWMST